MAPVLGQEAWEFAGDDNPEGNDEIEMVPVPERFARDEALERAEGPRLFGWSKVEEMRKRLRELDEPIYGDKDTLWKRLRKAEGELAQRGVAARDYQDAHGRRQQELREGRGGEVPLLPAPEEPSAEERERHEACHFPPARWCEFCIRGHAMDQPHWRQKLEDKLADNHFELDYSFLKTDTSLAASFEESSDTVLSLVDTGTNMALALSIPAKNLELPCVVQVITSFITQLGYTTVKLRSDNEPVIKKVVRMIAGSLREKKAPGAEGIKITFEETPRYSSQSLGSMGAFQKLLRGDVLTLRYAVEATYGVTIHTSHNLWPWLVRWASFLRNRFAVKSNQKTAYQDAFDTPYTSPILPFAETVMFKVPVSKARRTHSRAVVGKGETTWIRGIFLGRSISSNEYLVGTEDGVITGRSLRRLPPSRRHDKELLEKMVGVPWDFGTTINRPKRRLEIPSPVTPNIVKTEEKKADDLAEGPDAPAEGGPSSGSGFQRGGDLHDQQEETMQGQATPHTSGRRSMDGPHLEESPGKRLRIEGQMVGALYSPVEAEDVAGEDRPDESSDVEIEEQFDEESKPLTAEELKAGREEEFRKMDLYQTYEVVEWKPFMKVLDATWVDRRKPDGAVRCRYCVREFKKGDPRTDVFAVASSTSTSRVIDTIGIKKGYPFITGDAENAFWQVPIDEDAYMFPPKEWLLREENEKWRHVRAVSKLKKEWYGRRVAGQKFVEWAANHLQEIGMERSTFAPWLFYDAVRDVAMEVHMDDFFATGPKKALEELQEKLHCRIKMKMVIHEGECQFTHLKRTRQVFSDGIFITPRAKYVSDLLEMLGLADCNPSPTPYIHNEIPAGDPLNSVDAKHFRGGVGLALYLSYDRVDIQFAVRELTKDMKSPTKGSMIKLHRLARYLKGTDTYGVWLPKTGEMDKLVVHSDTDWANCKKTRKSCACGIFVVGGCLIYSYARSLQMICLSSGEAEFNGGVAACSEGIFLKEVFKFAGVGLDMEVYLDSSAARGVFQRQGCGRIRHLEVKSLWVQSAMMRKLFTLHAVPTKDNMADLGTKGLSAARFEELRKKLLVGSQEEVRYKTTSQVAAVQGTSKKALILSFLSLLQEADGSKEEVDEARITWTELIFVVIILMVVMRLLVVMCAWVGGQIKRGLSTRTADASSQTEDEWFETWAGGTRAIPGSVLHFAGSGVFHLGHHCRHVKRHPGNSNVKELILCRHCRCKDE